MRLFAVLAFLALLAAGPVGCGDGKKGDNSNIQSPNDQPIGGPQGLGGGLKSGQGGVPMNASNTKVNKPLPPVELKP